MPWQPDIDLWIPSRHQRFIFAADDEFDAVDIDEFGSDKNSDDMVYYNFNPRYSNIFNIYVFLFSHCIAFCYRWKKKKDTIDE